MYISIKDANGNIVSVEEAEFERAFANNSHTKEIHSLSKMYDDLGGQTPITKESIKTLVQTLNPSPPKEN